MAREMSQGSDMSDRLNNQYGDEEPTPEVGKTMSMIAAIALPNIAGYVLNLINELTNTVFIGHAGDDAALAAVGLGNMMQNCFGLSIGFGFTAALDMLVSQAYNRGEHMQTCYYLQRCRVLMTLMLIWMVPILAYSEFLLKWIGQSDEVAEDAGDYNRATVAGLFFIFQFEANRKFMQNRQWSTAPAVICALSSLLHIFWCGLFVLHLKLGNAGAGYANVVTWVTEFVLSSAYLAWNCQAMGLKKRDVLWVSKHAFGCENWYHYLSVALPATVQICSEWWFWEICAVIVGYLGEVSLAAHVATINFVAVTFMPTIGINASTATLAGIALGQNYPRQAKMTVWVCVALNFVIWVFLAALIFFARGPISSAYSDSPPVQEVMHELLTIFAIAGFLDTTQNVMGGALRGIGRPQKAALVYLVSFYVVMLPIGIILAFPLGLDVRGIYLSFLPGCGTAVLFFTWTLCCIDWVQLAQDAFYRVDSERSRSSGANSEAQSPQVHQHSNFGASLQEMGS